MENNYQLSRIYNYIHGLMSKEEMHALEREALEDPFLQDAIDGYRLQDGVDSKSLSLLQQRLARRVETHAQTKNKHFFNWQRLAVGAVAAVMFVSVCILILIRHLPHRQQNTVTEVELMDDRLFTKVQVQATDDTQAIPTGGWEAFENYLTDHYSGVEAEEFTVHFIIHEDGTPYDISNKGNRSDKIPSDLIEALQKGPKWQGTEATLKISYTH